MENFVDEIKAAEGRHERMIAETAERIAGDAEVKVVLIAGPSSSGKTSTCKRLGAELLKQGKRPLQISLDDYFVDREKSPLQPNGEYDYESIYALNLDLFNKQLEMLLNGEEVQLPRYNFVNGKSETSEVRLRLQPGDVLVIEGLHALNPMLTEKVDNRNIFRIYVATKTDNRLLRRIVRDAKTRGCDASATIRRWPSVRAGEDKWIFPYKGNADATLDTSLSYELAVLKPHAEPLLESVPKNSNEYAEACRLQKFLSNISPAPDTNVPPTSLLREFLGGSSFEY